MIRKQVIAVLSGMCMIASLQAQNNQPQKAVAAAAAVPDREMTVYNLDFPGGTPEQLIEQMAKASGTRPNVIIPNHGADIQLPKFKLQNVNSTQVFSALNTVSDENGALSLRWLSNGPEDAPNRVWTLAKVTPKPPKPEVCQVVFIGHLLKTFQLEDINAAVRTAWDMLGKGSNPTLKFHKETKLLIAKGTDEELKLAFQVLTSLDQASAASKSTEPSR